MTDATAYDAFQRGLALLQDGHPHAAAPSLERARELEPRKGSIREALARAYYNAQRFTDARDEFCETLAIDPANDYAHFGLGLALSRLGDQIGARGHLRMALAMRPESDHYRRALSRLSPSL